MGGRLTPGQTGRLTVGRKLTSTSCQVKNQNTIFASITFHYDFMPKQACDLLDRHTTAY
jgi:hypothetical protein